MSHRWWRPNHCPIGIDLGRSSVKLMQLERVGDGLRVVASAAVALRPELDPFSAEYHEAVGAAIRQGLSRGAFVGKACVSSMPSAVMQYKNLRLPPMPEAELASAVQWEAADRVRYQGQTPVVQFFDAGEVRQGTDVRREIILVAAPDRFIEQHTKTLQGLGLQPQAIDAAPAALARCLDESIRLVGAEPKSNPIGDPQDTTEPVAQPARVILEFGNSSSNIVIAVGASVVFFKQVAIGSASLDAAAVETLGWSVEEVAFVRRGDEDGEQPAVDRARKYAEYIGATQPLVNDLGREIGLCLRYYTVTFRGARPDGVSLIGGAGDQAFAERLAPVVGAPVSLADPLAGIDITPVRGAVPRSTHAAWGLAAGLSLRDFCGCPQARGAA